MILESVLPLTERGWRLFPCVERDKVPLLKNWPRSASSDMDVIRRWAQKHKSCNWGVATGPASGVFAVDVDGESGEKSFSSLVDQHGAWKETLAVTTARGQHFYFDWPASGTIRNSAGKLGAGVDVRGDGGYCVIPPSTHPSGARYEWTTANLQISPAPKWLLERITSATRTTAQAAEIGILPQGTRNDGLARLAGAMRRKGVALPEIEHALLEHNVRRCRPPLLDAEVRKIAESIARYGPGGPDPLQSAWQASEGEYGSNYQRFLALSRQLQQDRPEQAIALPLERIGELMGLHWSAVGIYRRKAVNAGLLQACGQYIPHRRAGLYRVSLGETLTKTLTSGLVRICQKPLVRNSPSEKVSTPLVRIASQEIAPSEKENAPDEVTPLVTSQESENPPRWKTPTFTVLSEAELAEKVAQSIATASRWHEIAGCA